MGGIVKQPHGDRPRVISRLIGNYLPGVVVLLRVNGIDRRNNQPQPATACHAARNKREAIEAR
jgi:hypothetical protein